DVRGYCWPTGCRRAGTRPARVCHDPTRHGRIPRPGSRTTSTSRYGRGWANLAPGFADSCTIPGVPPTTSSRPRGAPRILLRRRTWSFPDRLLPEAAVVEESGGV